MNNIEILKFTATWCGPCRMFQPVIDSVKSEFKDVKFTEVDIDNATELTTNYGIRAVPTVVILRNNKEETRFSGIVSKEHFASLIKQISELP